MTNAPLGDAMWQRVLSPAWKTIFLPAGAHLDEESAAAYAEGKLAVEAMRDCEAHLSQCPDCLAFVEELWRHIEIASADGLVVSASPRKDVGAVSALRSVLAASILLAASGWGMYWSGQANSQHLREANVRLQSELGDARTAIVLALKEDFAEATPSPMNSYWAMTTSPRILEAPQTRGQQPPTPESLTRAETLRQALQGMLAFPESRGWASLELSSLEMIAGRNEAADTAFKQAQQILGDKPEVKNVAAVRLLSRSDQESVAKAEKLLREVTRENPGYLPAWYNLALMLQQSFRDSDSRSAWEEYLSREQRPSFREAAKAQMSALQDPANDVFRNSRTKE